MLHWKKCPAQPYLYQLRQSCTTSTLSQGPEKGEIRMVQKQELPLWQRPHLWEGELSFLAVGTQAWAEGSINLFEILCVFLTIFCHFREDWNKKIQAGFTQKTDKTEHSNKKKNPVIPLCTLIYLNWQSTNTQILKKIKAYVPPNPIKCYCGLNPLMGSYITQRVDAVPQQHRYVLADKQQL